METPFPAVFLQTIHVDGIISVVRIDREKGRKEKDRENERREREGERGRERVGVRKGSSNCTTYSRNSAQSSVTSFCAQSSAACFIILLPSCLSNPTTRRM